MSETQTEFVQELIRISQTTITKAVFPGDTNHYDTLFGGTALQWMDEVAFITATRFSRLKVVTVSSDRVDFKKPIPAGSIVELRGNVLETGKTSIKVGVDVFLEDMYSDKRELALQGSFKLVAVNSEKKAIDILSNYQK